MSTLTEMEDEIETGCVDSGEPWLPLTRFFGEPAAVSLRDNYEKLRRLHHDLPRHTAKLIAARTDLAMENADKDDDLDEVEAGIVKKEEQLAGLEVSLDDLDTRRRVLQHKLGSPWHRFWFAVTFRRSAKQNELAEMVALQENMEDRIAREREELAAMQGDHGRLRAPIDALTARCDQIEKEIEEIEAVVLEARNRQIEICVDLVETCPNLDERCASVVDVVVHPRFFEAVVNRLKSGLIEEKELDRRLSSTISQAGNSQEELTRALDGLGRGFGAGFSLETTGANAHAGLNGSVDIEEKGFLGGTKISGTASGSGTGTASYSLQKPFWRPGADQTEAVLAFTEAFAAAGRRQAEIEFAETELKACRTRICEYVGYILDSLAPKLPPLGEVAE
ncbi:MAG: hypothetical protein QNK37_17400 [Acidobacteriota bacterium]|nr:hypothetical protein [Acidobacteriota bacterium]